MSTMAGIVRSSSRLLAASGSRRGLPTSSTSLGAHTRLLTPASGSRIFSSAGTGIGATGSSAGSHDFDNASSITTYHNESSDSSSHANTPENIVAHSEAMSKYRIDTQTLANWLDVSVIKIHGRLYPADNFVIPPTNVMCVPFPMQTMVTTLRHTDQTLDELVSPFQSQHSSRGDGRGLRLVTFSFKAYGHTLAESWALPFLESPLATEVPVISLCFVEYGFLSLAKGAFLGNLKKEVDESRWDRTAFIFGGVMDFATRLLLPNKFTGYAYLIDDFGRVRWRGCGKAEEEDLEALYKCTQELLHEQEDARCI